MSCKIFNNVFTNSKRLSVSNCTIFFRRRTEIAANVDENRYKAADIEQETILSSAFTNNKVPTIEDWPSLKHSVLSKGKTINEINFDARALGYCIEHKNFEAGKSLVKYFESKNEKLNIAALGKFMKLCHVCNESNSFVSEDDEEIILSLYKQIRDQYPVLTSITAENIIPALSLTSEWRKCLDLLKDIKSITKPNCGSYSFVAKAAFENEENNLGWDLLRQMIDDDKLPHPSVYKIWLKKTKENEEKIIEKVEFMFKYFAQNDIFPTKDVIDDSLDLLKPYSYTGVYTSIDKKKNICESCSQKLKPIKISLAEFESLKNVFMENVVIGKNIFTKTNPEELERFNKFLSGAKFDIVIDGLNVAYSAGTRQRPEVYGKLLANVVNHYRFKNSKILILGRTHMNKWPKKYLDYIKSNAQMFLAQNLSQDDPFLLYAAMKSGLGTNFLSRDFMRGHLYLLFDSKLKKLFRKWQQLHQHTLIYAENNGQVHIKKPFPYLCAVQQFPKGWHIPYVNTFSSNPPVSFDVPQNWLCLHKL